MVKKDNTILKHNYHYKCKYCNTYFKLCGKWFFKHYSKKHPDLNIEAVKLNR